MRNPLALMVVLVGGPLLAQAGIRETIAEHEQATDRVIAESKRYSIGPEREEYLRKNLPEKAPVARALLAICEASTHAADTFDALAWILQVRAGSNFEGEARVKLLEHHRAHPRLSSWVLGLEWSLEDWCDAWLRDLEATAPPREALGACLYVRARRQLRAADAMWKDLRKIPLATAVDSLRASAESLLTRVQSEFSDLTLGSIFTLGQRAATDLYDLRVTALGRLAPDIEGENERGERMTLRESRGRVVVLSFWGFW